MALHKLLVDQFYDDAFTLLALHCTIEDYRVAYLLNQYLNINLKRQKKDVDFEYTKASYALYQWEDSKKQMTWNLVSNICKREEESLVSSGLLFNNEEKITRTFNLIPEFKNVNYFLKIHNDGNYINEKIIIDKLHKIPQLAAVYTVDASEVKSKDNLIFD